MFTQKGLFFKLKLKSYETLLAGSHDFLLKCFDQFKPLMNLGGQQI